MPRNSLKSNLGNDLEHINVDNVPQRSHQEVTKEVGKDGTNGVSKEVRE